MYNTYNTYIYNQLKHIDPPPIGEVVDELKPIKRS